MSVTTGLGKLADARVNLLIETLARGENGVECEVVRVYVDTFELHAHHEVTGYVLARKNYDGSYVSWAFTDNITRGGHYDMDASDGELDVKSRLNASKIYKMVVCEGESPSPTKRGKSGMEMLNTLQCYMPSHELLQDVAKALPDDKLKEICEFIARMRDIELDRPTLSDIAKLFP